MDGFIVVDKPVGMTSHDVVGAVRRITGQKKVGHTGTLDPFATGVLPVALGEATKAITFLDESVKEYQAVMQLGVATDTQDYTGAIVREGDWSHVTSAALDDVCCQFTGTQSQIPPMFSALKQNGVPLYRLARQGSEVPRQPREIKIHSLVLDGVNLPEVAFTVRCSRGTYVRTLADDIGRKLGCGAHLIRLRRTRSGPFDLGTAITLEMWAECLKDGRPADRLVTPYAALDHFRAIGLTDKGAARVAHGISPVHEDLLDCPEVGFRQGEQIRLSVGGELLAVAEAGRRAVDPNQQHIKLLRVFNQYNSFT